jgi:ArsR family transcriptional regulator
MKMKDAIAALSALAQETRLEVFRQLMRSLPEGIAAGDLAAELGVPPSTMSAHLSILLNAGLVTSERDGRSIAYRANQDGIGDLLQFLVKDCCRGRPEACARLLQAALPQCCG